MALNMIINISMIEHQWFLIRMVFTDTLYILSILMYIIILWIFSVSSMLLLKSSFWHEAKKNSGRKL